MFEMTEIVQHCIQMSLNFSFFLLKLRPLPCIQFDTTHESPQNTTYYNKNDKVHEYYIIHTFKDELSNRMATTNQDPLMDSY